MSKNIFFRSVLSIFLIISISLGNVGIVLADDPTPPTATAEPTEEPTQPVDEPTATASETPSGEEQVPAVEEASTPSLFSQVPEDTTIVVLDENGNSIPLVSQDGLDAILEDDPMWCPGTTPPGSIGCLNFTGPTGITDLLEDMRDNTDLYDENGTIYFTVNPGNGSFTLTDDDLSLDTDFSTLANFNLILQGGWNGDTVDPQYTQTNFGSNSITIGTSSNPWVGNITLNNFTFNGVSSTNAVTVYTTSGDIALNNVDVSQQTGGNNTANLVSSSGDIMVQNGSTFDGNTGGTNQGFNASTTTGTITITGTAANPITFTDASGSGSGTNYNGATLSAPTVTLTNVTATNNDLNGIYITNATTVTLTNVISGNNISGNGTNPPGANNSVGSGVYIQGPAGGTNVFIDGGYFANNERYGIEIVNGTLTTGTAPTYGTGGNSNGIGDLSINTAPTLTVPANITVEATGPTGVVVSFTVTATDVEDNPDPTPTCNRTSGSVFAIGTTTVNCTVTDSRGVTTAKSFTVTVRDTTGPALTLPANITQEATGPAGGVVTYTASATDLVDGPRTISCAPISGSTFAIGTTTVNCSSTDTRGNTGTGSFTVTVRDITPPAIAAHLNVIAEATSAAGAIVNYANPSTTDIVDGAGIATCAPASGSTFALGNNTVTCNATDTHGNAATPTTFTVTVQDTTAPTLNLPANITAEATGLTGAIVTYSASASDLVDVSVSLNCSPVSGSTFPFGTTTVNCFASDDYNNTSNGSFTVTVQDKTAPSLNLPANIVEEATSAAGNIVSYTASASDSVDGILPVTCSPISGSLFALGTTKVICSATDTQNNTANGSFTVTVQDTTSPIISAHGNVTAEAASAAGAVVAYTNPSTTDIVDGAGIATCAPASGSTFALGNTTVTCNATDTNGNPATPTTFTVTVEDTTAPSLNLPANMTAEATGLTGALVTYSASASDLVDASVLVSCSPTSGSIFPFGATTVNCSAADDFSNTANGSFTVTVQDTTPPAIAAHVNVIAEATSAAGAVVTYTNPSTSDIVDGAGTATCAPASGSTFVLGNTTVTCNATDTRGNAATPTTFTITVQDTTAPTLNLPANITMEATGLTGAIVTYSASASDLVDASVLVSCSPVSGSTFPIGTTTVNCSTTDDYNNSSNGSFTVTVQDKTSPSLNLPANIVEEATSAAGNIVTYTASASDIVDGVLQATCSPISGSVFALGTTTVNCSATDTQNNTTNGSFNITVQDMTSPVIAQPANIIFVTNNSSKKDILFYQSPTTTDIVDGTGSATCTPASGSVFNVGNTTVTCTAVDSHGNAAEPVIFTITLQYIEPINPGNGNGNGTSTIIPITGGETIALDCNTQVMMLNIKVSFYNLCERQAILNSVDANSLPGSLPAGFTFVAGLNVTVLNQSQLLDPLPAGAGIEMDFPIKGASDQFVVLFWSNGKWVEVTQSLKESDLAKALNNDVSNELYKITTSGNNLYKVLTTEKTGTFILVKK